MSDEPATPHEKKITCCLGVGLVVFAFAAIVGLGLWEHSKFKAAHVTDGWERSEMAGAAFEVPFKLELRPDVSQRVLAATNLVEPTIESASIWEGEQSVNKLRIGLHRIEYKSGIVPNLDGAIQGAVSNAAAKLGDANPKYSVNAFRVSGLDARKVTCYLKVRGVDLRIDAVVVARGRTMWQLQTFLMDSALAPVVDRVVASLEILPP